MYSIVIRRCLKKDEGAIINICHDTGFLGEDLKNKNIFKELIVT